MPWTRTRMPSRIAALFRAGRALMLVSRSELSRMPALVHQEAGDVMAPGILKFGCMPRAEQGRRCRSCTQLPEALPAKQQQGEQCRVRKDA